MSQAISRLSQSERDTVIADLVLFAKRAITILEELTEHSNLTAKEKKEIEDSITVGPAWLNYTRKVKRRKT